MTKTEPFLRTINEIVKRRWGTIEDFCKAHEHPVGGEPGWDMRAMFAVIKTRYGGVKPFIAKFQGE